MEIRREVFEKVVLKERWLLAIHLHGNKKGSFFEKVVSKERWPLVSNSFTWK